MNRFFIKCACLALLACCLLLLPMEASAKRLHREAWYQDRFCGQVEGEVEVVMPSGSRCDCLTGEYAIEFDFADKWAESIGQALLYARETGLKPGVVLIIEDDEDLRYVDRFRLAVEGLDIRLWLLWPDQCEGMGE